MREKNVEVIGALLKLAFSRFVESVPGKNMFPFESTVGYPIFFDFGVWDSRLRRTKAQCDKRTNKNAQNDALHCNPENLERMISKLQKCFIFIPTEYYYYLLIYLYLYPL